jgi:hypothetical protein
MILHVDAAPESAAKWAHCSTSSLLPAFLVYWNSFQMPVWMQYSNFSNISKCMIHYIFDFGNDACSAQTCGGNAERMQQALLVITVMMGGVFYSSMIGVICNTGTNLLLLCCWF